MAFVRFCGAALAGLALLVTANVARSQTMTMTYDTDSGPLNMVFTGSSHAVTGDYPDYGGHITGEMISSERIEGTWWQTSSKGVTKCAEQINGTFYWGKFALTEDADEKGFKGKWGSCGTALDGNWNGKLRE